MSEATDRMAAATEQVADTILRKRLVPEKLKVFKVQRYNNSVKQALLRNPEIQMCTESLLGAGFNFELEKGAKFFGRPDQFTPMMCAMRAAKFQPKFYHVIVALDLEQSVRSVIRSLSREQVKLKPERIMTTMPSYSDDVRSPVRIKSTFLHIDVPASNDSCRLSSDATPATV